MSSPAKWNRSSWPTFEPRHKPVPHRHKPRGVGSKPWCLVVAVYNDAQPGISTMQLWDAYAGTQQGMGWVSYPESWTTGLTGTPTQGTFYAQDTFSLRGSFTGEQPLTEATPDSSGMYLPEFSLNSIVFNPGDNFLYVQGVTESQVGILQYPSAEGAPPPANPMYLAGIASANTGMGLYQDGLGDTVLILPQYEGLSICPLTEAGTGSVPPSDLGPIPYSALQGISLPNGVCGPRQGPDGNLYFLTFADDPAAGTGIISVSPADALEPLGMGTPAADLMIPVNVIVAVGETASANALPYNGSGAFAVGPVGPAGAQLTEALIYYVVSAWDSSGAPTWSILTITTGGQISTLIGPQPGICSAICLQWM